MTATPRQALALPPTETEPPMINTPSPLETLAAFATVFFASALSTAARGTDIGKLRQAASLRAAPSGA